MYYQESAGWRIMTLVKYAMSSLFAPLARASKTGLRGNSDNSCPFCSFSSRANYLVRSILLFPLSLCDVMSFGQARAKMRTQASLGRNFARVFQKLNTLSSLNWCSSELYTRKCGAKKALCLVSDIYVHFELFDFIFGNCEMSHNVSSNKISCALCIVVSLRWTRTWISALHCVLQFPKVFLVIPSSRGSRFLDVSEHFTWFHWRTKDQRINPCPYLFTE